MGSFIIIRGIVDIYNRTDVIFSLRRHYTRHWRHLFDVSTSLTSFSDSDVIIQITDVFSCLWRHWKRHWRHLFYVINATDLVSAICYIMLRHCRRVPLVASLCKSLTSFAVCDVIIHQTGVIYFTSSTSLTSFPACDVIYTWHWRHLFYIIKVTDVISCMWRHYTLHWRHLFYVINVIMPSLMTSVLLLSIFFCTPAQKVQIGVVVLLSFRIFLLNVSGNIPKTSDHVPLLGTVAIF